MRHHSAWFHSRPAVPGGGDPVGAEEFFTGGAEVSVSLTPPQAALLAFLRSHFAAHGVMPSFAEMMLHLDLRSKAAVHRLLGCLEDRGHIRRMPHKARAISLTGGEVSTADALSAVLTRCDLSEAGARELRRLMAAEVAA